MKRTKFAAVALCLVMVAGGATACGSDEHTDSAPEHNDVGAADPMVSDAGVVAQNVTRILLTWTPADQDSPWAVPGGTVNMLGGKAKELALHPSSDDAKSYRPSAWNDWASADARLQGIAQTGEIQDQSDDAARVHVPAHQELIYPDGSRSVQPELNLTVTLERNGEQWLVTKITGWPGK